MNEKLQEIIKEEEVLPVNRSKKSALKAVRETFVTAAKRDGAGLRYNKVKFAGIQITAKIPNSRKFFRALQKRNKSKFNAMLAAVQDNDLYYSYG